MPAMRNYPMMTFLSTFCHYQLFTFPLRLTVLISYPTSVKYQYASVYIYWPSNQTIYIPRKNSPLEGLYKAYLCPVCPAMDGYDNNAMTHFLNLSVLNTCCDFLPLPVIPNTRQQADYIHTYKPLQITTFIYPELNLFVTDSIYYSFL